MFNSLVYIGYDEVNSCNLFDLFDSCFTHRITTGHGSPSLARTKNSANSNALTALAVFKHYECINRNVALNLAHYYRWLYEEGFFINKKFIKSHLSLLDQTLGLKLNLKYYRNIIIYLTEKHLISGLE